MRCDRLVVTLLVLAGATLTLHADEIVLKGGKTLTTSRPMVVKGKNAVVTLKDGTVVSLPLTEIDQPKTAEANKARVVVQAAPTNRQPETPAEAARVKNTRKAAISLSDDDVSHPFGQSPGAQVKEEGDGKVEVVSVAVKKEKSGYSLSGSVFNSGKGDVLAVSVTVEAIAEDNKTIATAFGNVAKDYLSAGEKSAFTAELATEAAVSSFRYVPHWQGRPVAKPAVGGGTLSQGSGGDAANAPKKPGTDATPEPTPAPKPVAKPEPTRAPQPDYAPPAANAPVGAPTQPGGTYLPQPSADGQPKQPGS
ncbi:MAG: hypothetical protein ABIT01_01705 [Thermoanaerobaculia bacterium]